MCENGRFASVGALELRDIARGSGFFDGVQFYYFLININYQNLYVVFTKHLCTPEVITWLEAINRPISYS